MLTPDVAEKPTADNFAVVTNRRYEVYVDNVGKYRYWGPFGPGNDARVTVSEAYDTLAAAEKACALAAQLGDDCLTLVLADDEEVIAAWPALLWLVRVGRTARRFNRPDSAEDRCV